MYPAMMLCGYAHGVVVQRPELEQRDRLGEVKVATHDFIIDDLAWLEDVSSAEVV
jgi:hypothetical protein